MLEQKKNQVILNFKQGLDESRQREAGVCQYIWGTVGDERVRDSHEANEGQVFSWNNPPETGHPGEAENCRCSADPVVDGLHEDCEDAEEYLKNLTAKDLAAIILALAAIYTIPGKVAAVVVVTRQAIVRKLGSEAAKQIEEAAAAAPKPAEPAPAKPAAPKPQTPKPDISKRPEGVPKDWKASPTKNGDGKIYQHPTEKGTYVKVEKGNPSASQPGQRYDNVRVQKNGKSYDKNGNVVPRRSRESHIPLEDFNPKNFNL